jgi:hypothetical protein
VEGVVGRREVISALVEAKKVEPGDMCMKGVANLAHVLLCDDAFKMMYKGGKEEGCDVRANGW